MGDRLQILHPLGGELNERQLKYKTTTEEQGIKIIGFVFREVPCFPWLKKGFTA